MNGVLLINKEPGMTSFDVIFRLRKLTGCKKIGHTGTLDPDATGVMVVLFGKATKLLPYLKDDDKKYVATLKLGVQTTTDDIYGEVIATKAITPITNFKALLQTFKGAQKQLPPMISSVKVNGMKLQEYARKNIPVQRELRDIEIFDIGVIDEQQLKFFVHCSSGTFVRSLCVDIAKATNNLGCMGTLIRSDVGRFNLKDCVTLADVEKGNYTLLDSSILLEHIPKVTVESPTDAYYGKRIKIDSEYDQVIIQDKQTLIAIYKRENGNQFRSERGIW